MIMRSCKKKRKSFENDISNIGKQKIFDSFVPLICKKCNKSFDKKTCLKTHMKLHDFDDHTYESKVLPTPSLDKLKPHRCGLCEKKFTVKKNLLKHLRTIHKNPQEAEKLKVNKTRCPEVNCSFSCHKMQDLRSHIEKYHQTKILRDVLQFSDETSFIKWKKEEEDKSMASFISYRGKVQLKNHITKRVLSCHRTGTYNPKGTGKHRLKSHGSCKMGGTCPAAMEVVKYSDGQITVTYFKTHLGHLQDVVHLSLSKEEKEELSERINQGFSLDAILEDVKESIDPVVGETKRIHLLSRKDLYNIMKSNSIKKIKKNDLQNGFKELLNRVIGNDNENTVNMVEQSSAFMKNVAGKEREAESFQSREIFVDGVIVCSNVSNNIKETSALYSKGETPCTTQLVIISPNDNHRSIAKLILMQQPETEATTPHTLNLPMILPKNTSSGAAIDKKGVPNTELIQRSRNEFQFMHSCFANTPIQSPLVIKLQEKLQKLHDLLPTSESLTPKQFEKINTKLDNVIGLFRSAKNNLESKGKDSSLKKKPRRVVRKMNMLE